MKAFREKRQLTGSEYKAFQKEYPNWRENADLRKIKDGVELINTNENYRFVNLDEWFAETMKDVTFDSNRLSSGPRTVWQAIKDFIVDFYERVKDAFGPEDTQKIFRRFLRGEYDGIKRGGLSTADIKKLDTEARWQSAPLKPEQKPDLKPNTSGIHSAIYDVGEGAKLQILSDLGNVHMRFQSGAQWTPDNIRAMDDSIRSFNQAADSNTRGNIIEYFNRFAEAHNLMDDFGVYEQTPYRDQLYKIVDDWFKVHVEKIDSKFEKEMQDVLERRNSGEITARS
jgi:hypothetical protein